MIFSRVIISTAATVTNFPLVLDLVTFCIFHFINFARDRGDIEKNTRE